MSDESSEYEVGFGKPPKATRFKKGESGNRKGRPKGARGLKTDLKAELNERVSITMNGQVKKLTKQQLMLKQLSSQAVKGNLRAISKLIELAAATLGVEDETVTGKASLASDDEAILQSFMLRLSKEEQGSDA